MKRREAMSIGDIIADAMSRAGLSDVMARQRACYLWSELVGPGVTRYATRRYVTDDGVLHIEISSGPLAQELMMARSSMRDELNRRVGCDAITEIRIN